MGSTLAKMGSNPLQSGFILSGEQVRAARSLLGWSRRELALVSGVSAGTIKAIELGITDPRLSTLRKLAKMFAAHAVEFVFLERGSGVVLKDVSAAKRSNSLRATRHDVIAPSEPLIGNRSVSTEVKGSRATEKDD